MKQLLRFVALPVLLTVALAGTGALASTGAEAASPQTKAVPHVLLVGTFKGMAGAFSTIQSAVNAASPGDWILIAPGVYHETGTPSDGVRVTTPGIHIRGLDRNGVVVDGTQAGSGTCSPNAAAQVVGPGGAGRNGIEVFKVDGVTIENLTACNFLDGAGSGGNQIWWNGGDGSGVIGMGSYHGAYLTASTTYYSSNHSAAYGIFVSNSRGPGVIEQSYASNMSDSDFYVGACPDCNAVLSRVHAQNSPQGFSGTNAGGHLVLEFSEWDHNRVGIASTTLAADDLPSPQNGACPNQSTSCTLIQNNFVHDNNVASTPGEGIAATVPIGTGILLSGGRNDTVRGNLVTGNGAWGVLANDYPDSSLGSPCTGGDAFYNPPFPYNQILGPIIPCYFHSFGNQVYQNRFSGNGSFSNLTNGDLANAVIDFPARNCFYGNTDLKGKLTSFPVNIQKPSVAGTCRGAWVTDPNQEPALFLELICDSFGPSSGACAPTDHYPNPTQTAVVLMPIPQERGMADPCEGVPANSWCK